MNDDNVRRDFGVTWKTRLANARKKANTPGPRLSTETIANLRTAVATLDVSSPEDKAFLWSGRGIPTEVRLNEGDPNGAIWWDNLAPHEAEVFRHLGIGYSLEDTVGGQALINEGLNYAEDDPLLVVAQELWDTLSIRFVSAASGRVEIIAEGSFAESVFRRVELETLLSSERITAVNGLDRKLIPSTVSEAFALVRRWDVERSRRYSEFIAADADAAPYERASALDDFREIQLWYEQDFFDSLGPERALPALSVELIAAVDQSMAARTWKYSVAWREYIKKSGEKDIAL
jgi:hypothetical protein